MGLSKKSLDDYLLQIRFAKRFGFDFEAHRNDNIGILRQFVKRMKDAEKQKKILSGATDSDPNVNFNTSLGSSSLSLSLNLSQQ